MFLYAKQQIIRETIIGKFTQVFKGGEYFQGVPSCRSVIFEQCGDSSITVCRPLVFT